MIHSPVILVGCARSGTTLLYHLLSEVPDLWSIGGESGPLIERWHHPRHKHWASGALDASDVTPSSRAGLLKAFEQAAAPGTYWRKVNRFRAWLRGRSFWQRVKERGQTRRPGSAVSSVLPLRGMGFFRGLGRLPHSWPGSPVAQPIRLLEKTPENCLRLPFLLALFPDARIIYLTRDGRSNISSLIEGWKHPHLFHGYTPPAALNIPGNGRPGTWAFTLIPGWQELAGGPLERISAQQWVLCNEAVLEHRAVVKDQVPYLTVRYEDLIDAPEPTLRSIAGFIHISFEESLLRYQTALPAINIVSPPDKDKWRHRHHKEVTGILPLIEPTMNRLGYRCEGP